jgi:hypothetical protein
MKKTVVSIIVSCMAVFGILISMPSNNVQASEISPNAAVQSIYLTAYSVSGFKEKPPSLYFYNDGHFQGYLTLEDWYTVGKLWTGVYSGYAYYPYSPGM